MKSRLFNLVSLLLLGLTAVLAKKDKPDIEETKFKSLPTNLFYFEDSDVVIVQDTLPGIIYRSADAGATWEQVDEIKESESLEVLPHPYNNQVAVALGTAKEHWITKDQGKTWKTFKTNGNPVLGRAPINYHATDPDKVIVLISDCEGFTCKNKVRISSGQQGAADATRHTIPPTASSRSSYSATRSFHVYGQRARIFLQPVTRRWTEIRSCVW